MSLILPPLDTVMAITHLANCMSIGSSCGLHCVELSQSMTIEALIKFGAREFIRTGHPSRDGSFLAIGKSKGSRLLITCLNRGGTTPILLSR